MKYKAYPEYKDSGVKMLGDLPSNWETKQIRYLLRDGEEGIKIGPFGSALKLEDMVDSGIRVYGQENVIKKDFTLGKRRIDASKFAEMRVYQTYSNDLLITMMGTSGKCELVPEHADEGIIDSHLLRLRVKEDEILPRFFRLLIDECYEIENQIKISGKGSIMHGLNSSIVKSLELPLPSVVEQAKILDFLDHETAKIDTLIEKQQQLIKLLKEKRQAVISHAVTKGLNPNAPMRDSGIEWLGEVPEHWEVAPLRRYLIEHKQGYYTTEGYVDDGVKLLRITDLRDLGNIDISSCPQVSNDDLSLKNYELLDGDVVFARTGGAGSFGVVKDLKERVVFASYLIRFRFQGKFYQNDYLRYLLLGDSFQKAVKQNIHGGVNQNLHAEDIKNTCLTRPPLSEQTKITKYLDDKCTKINHLIEKAQNAIELMQERRTALISAVVTGKIDVRHYCHGTHG